MIDGTKSDSCREESERERSRGGPRQTSWKGAKKSQYHEHRVDGHETKMSGIPGIGFVDVDVD
jgi:hypothetical protein